MYGTKLDEAFLRRTAHLRLSSKNNPFFCFLTPFFTVCEIFNCFIILQVSATFSVGAAIHGTITHDFAFIGAPLLMGTVALGRPEKSILY